MHNREAPAWCLGMLGGHTGWGFISSTHRPHLSEVEELMGTAESSSALGVVLRPGLHRGIKGKGHKEC